MRFLGKSRVSKKSVCSGAFFSRAWRRRELFSIHKLLIFYRHRDPSCAVEAAQQGDGTRQQALGDNLGRGHGFSHTTQRGLENE